MVYEYLVRYVHMYVCTLQLSEMDETEAWPNYVLRTKLPQFRVHICTNTGF
jgi:hypothetical protein